jgi:filamentous hemagglutinin family protein
MSLKNSLSWSLLLCTFTPSSWAEITLDGSLGRSGALIGPNYAISADFGKQIGGNLFHSFRDFNLDQNESATFSGPNTVNNVISRVTGGKPSQINGLLRSTIPNADVYLLNPAGIMFGAGAKLDVQGGFHASTADTLRLGSDGEFNASDIEQSVLTVATPRAFGFLAAKPAAITLQDSKLSVPIGKTLSLIGGEINISAKPLDINNLEDFFSPTISAKSGRFNLASIASPGEITVTESSLNLSEQSQRGAITVNQSIIDLSGEGGGSVFIRGGHLKLIKSDINSETLGSEDGKAINIQVEQLELQGFSLAPDKPGIFGLSTQSSGTGKAGNVEIKAHQIKLTGNAIIYAGTYEMGDAGNVEIEARQIELTDKAKIYTGTDGIGDGGDITIKADEGLILAGHSGISASPLNEEISNSGDAGKIMIAAQQITLTDDSFITNGTLGTGNGGPITLLVRDALTVQSGNIHAHSVGVGDAGKIDITARQLILTEGGQVGSAPFNRGKSGSVSIKANTLMASGYEVNEESDTGYSSSGISTASFNSSNAGNIDVQVHQLELTDGAQISSSTHGSGNGGIINIKADELIVSGKISNTNTKFSGIFAKSKGDVGDAGDITVQANNINLTEGGVITTQADNASGGNINIIVPNSLYLQAGAITTDVKNGQGDGGKINIAKPDLVVLNNSEIITKADQGRGGRIHINTDKFIRSADSLLDASSRVEGRSGEIKIEADSYVGNGLITSPKDFLNPPTLQRCETRFATKETSSRFIRTNRAKMRRDELKEGVWGSYSDLTPD